MAERFLVAGELRLDVVERSVSKGGRPLRVGGRSFDLLLTLMQSPQELVSKAQLFEAVWPTLAVSEAVLTTAIKELRQALGDNAREPVFIATVHGRGYRFLLPVEPIDPEAVAAARPEPPEVAHQPRARWGMMAAAAGAVLLLILLLFPLRGFGDPDVPSGNPKSVAVLPFRDYSPGKDLGWFADGLTDEITGRLSRTPDLQVAARSATERFRSGNPGVPSIAAALQVSHLLEGSVRSDGDRVRVSVRLVRASDGRQIWSENYDRPVRDMIPIQEDIAYRIAVALKTVMDPATLQAMVAVGTRSPEAYEAYLRGVALDQRQLAGGSLADARAAADAYERARTLDPNFAAAHWMAAQSWFGNATRVDSHAQGASLSEAERRARYAERVERAIAVSRDPVEALKYQAALAVMQLRIQAAQRLMADYLARRPQDIDAWEEMGDIAAYAGNQDGMRKAAERIHRLSIESGNPRSRAITLSVMAMDVDAAVARAREQLALRPDHALTQYQSHRAMIWAGELEEARGLLRRVMLSGMDPGSRELARLRQLCAEGRLKEAQALRAALSGSADRNKRWHAAELMGDSEVASADLQPLDTAEHLPTLMQYMMNPNFDAARFPNLAAVLERDGTVARRPVPLPGACASPRHR